MHILYIKMGMSNRYLRAFETWSCLSVSIVSELLCSSKSHIDLERSPH